MFIVVWRPTEEPISSARRFLEPGGVIKHLTGTVIVRRSILDTVRHKWALCCIQAPVGFSAPVLTGGVECLATSVTTPRRPPLLLYCRATLSRPATDAFHVLVPQSSAERFALERTARSTLSSYRRTRVVEPSRDLFGARRGDSYPPAGNIDRSHGATATAPAKQSLHGEEGRLASQVGEAH